MRPLADLRVALAVLALDALDLAQILKAYDAQPDLAHLPRQGRVNVICGGEIVTAVSVAVALGDSAKRRLNGADRFHDRARYGLDVHSTPSENPARLETVMVDCSAMLSIHVSTRGSSPLLRRHMK